MARPSGKKSVRHAPLIGAHVPAGGGLAKRALGYVDATGAECLQVFVTNPRGWAAYRGDPQQDALFREATATSLPAFVHASFLINLGSPDADIAQKSAESLAHTVTRAMTVGARGVVVHTGSAVRESRRDEALAQVRELLLPVLDTLPDDAPFVLLEPTAGQGQSLCSTLDELDEYLHLLGHHPRLGICIDTCHAFAAGHDLAADRGMNDFLDHLDKVRGAVPVGLVHLNDSMDVVGAKHDRHTPIGDGHIGAAPFADLFAHPTMAGIPMVLETPGKEPEHKAEIALLKTLRP